MAVRGHSPGWWLQLLGTAHAVVGGAVYGRALAEIADNKLIKAVPVSGDRATAFWFMSLSPALWLGGRLLRSAERTHDLNAQRAAGSVLIATGVLGATAIPVSGFWAVAAVGVGAIRHSRHST